MSDIISNHFWCLIFVWFSLVLGIASHDFHSRHCRWTFLCSGSPWTTFTIYNGLAADYFSCSAHRELFSIFGIAENDFGYQKFLRTIFHALYFRESFSNVWHCGRSSWSAEIVLYHLLYPALQRIIFLVHDGSPQPTLNGVAANHF